MTLIVWCTGRFFLYTSYYSIFGALFGFTNFGRMVAIDNTINGLVGLLQLPLTNWGLQGLGGNFTAINMIQVGPPSLPSAEAPCCVLPVGMLSRTFSPSAELKGHQEALPAPRATSGS